MDSAKSFEAKFKRILDAAAVTKDAELARALSIKPQSIAAARKRGQIPSGWVEKVAEKFEVSADWLFFGVGEMLRGKIPQLTTQNHSELEQAFAKEKELTRELALENRQLLKDNAELRVELEKMKARAAPEDKTPPEATRKSA